MHYSCISVFVFGLCTSAWPDNTLSPPGPFLDCHVWLTQSAATRMGVHPSLESPAVRGYIIAEPCWACWTAFVRLSLNVIVGKIKRRVRSRCQGVPTWSPAETTEQTESEVLGSTLMWLSESRIPFHIVFMNSVSSLHAWCFMLAKGSNSAAWGGP